jgi:hypothetical protein
MDIELVDDIDEETRRLTLSAGEVFELVFKDVHPQKSRQCTS